MRQLRKSVPLLSWMATTKLALYYRPECTRITASIAVAISIDVPKSSYALPINPHLTLPHASHVQSQGLVSFWCIKTGLQVQSDMLIYTYRFWIYFESTLNPIKQCKEENKTIVPRVLSCSQPYTTSMAVVYVPLRTLASNQLMRKSLENLISWILLEAQPV